MLLLLENILHALSSYLKSGHDKCESIAIYCPYHRDFHTRGGEAAFPFVYLGKTTGQNGMLEKGLRLADWLVHRQNTDGSWSESPGPWKGTSVFQLMALCAVLDTCGSDVSRGRLSSYESGIVKGADWVKGNISIRRATTNYIASGAAGLAFADKLFPGRGWDKAAKRLARIAAKNINTDGLIEGEGVGKRILKMIYLRPKGIDIGYGLEMTLSSLALYLSFIDDDRVFSAFHRALQSHVLFLYPDGALDDSIGSRGYKWTIYGSKTTHGSQMALAFGALHDPRFSQALALTTDCLRKYARNGLLPDGPHIGSKAGVSCLYPSITKSTNLAFALRYFPCAAPSYDSNPGEATLWVQKFASLNSLMLRRIPWKATVSGYHYTVRYPRMTAGKAFQVPGGGALTQLFHDGWGLIQAATQLDYQQVEILHVPKPEGHLYSFTPRIILQSASGISSNVYCNHTKITYQESQHSVIVTAFGHFFSPEATRERLKSYFTITYTFSESSVNKEYVINLAHPVSRMAIVEPIVFQDGAKLDLSSGDLSFVKDGKRLVCQSTKPSTNWRVYEKSVIYCPLPSLMGMFTQCEWERPCSGQYEAGINITIQ